MDRKRYMKSYRATYRSRTRDVRIALGTDLYDHLKSVASAEGIPPTTLARALIEAGLHRRSLVPAAVLDELRTLERLVRNIANNINQLAHHANTVRRVVDLDAVYRELQRLDAAVRDHTLKRLT